MKKLLTVLLVLGLASLAQAAVSFQAPGVNVQEVKPSDIIRIQLISDATNVFGMQFDVLSDKGGEASAPALATGWNAGYEGLAMNQGGTLISYVQAAQTGVPPTKLGGTLFSFSFHVPELPPSTFITISWGPYGGYDNPYIATMDSAGNRVDVAAGSLVLHVIPEPMTMALLAVGGLVALRRRHA